MGYLKDRVSADYRTAEEGIHSLKTSKDRSG